MKVVKRLIKFFRKQVLRDLHNYWAKQWKKRKVIYSFLGNGAEIDRLLSDKNKFFILGAGRSGTQMLSGLLNLDSSVLVLHEPAFFEDRFTRNLARKSELNFYEYLFDFRKHLIFKELRKHKDVKSYGEVTGTLRYHATGLKGVFLEGQILILARDGRDVVRSIMQHDFYTETSVKDGDTSPLPQQGYFDDWEEMSRFEKVCWLWADSYTNLLESVPESKVINFEKIINDFDYCNEQVFSFLGIQIGYQEWEKYLSKKSNNAIKIHEFPHWKDWSQKNRDDFDQICGSVMNKLGYEYNWQ